MDQLNKNNSVKSEQLEEDILKIWQKILDRQQIDMNDDFYELGGNSLSALRILAEIEKEFKTPIPLAAFPKVSTVKKMAIFLKEQESWTYITPIQPKGSRYPLFFIPPSARSSLIFKDLAKHLGEDQPFYGLEHAGMDADTEIHTDVREMARHHIAELTKVQAEGPYYIGGMCFGGMVAYEIAHQLVAKGQEVAFLGVLDSSFPPQQKITLFTRLIIGISLINDKFLNGSLPLGPRGPRARMLRPVEDEVLNRRIMEVFTTHSYARMRYTSHPYPGKITLFATQRRNAERIKQLWQRAAKEELDVVTVPGLHGRRFEGGDLGRSPFIDEPHVQALAKLLSESLEKARIN